MKNKAQFNELIHAPKRLRICAFLASVKEVEFKVLAEALGLKDSDLSKQLKLLEHNGLLNSRKETVNTRQKTWLAFSDNGRETFEAHAIALRAML